MFNISLVASVGRHRRDNAENDDQKSELWKHILNLEKLTEFVQQKSNETFQKEIGAVLTKLIKNFPVKQLCKNIEVKCRKGIKHLHPLCLLYTGCCNNKGFKMVLKKLNIHHIHYRFNQYHSMNIPLFYIIFYIIR